VLPRIAQLFSSYPHLTNRYLNLLRFGERFDRQDYERTLAAIDPDTRAQVESGERMSAGWLAPAVVGIPSVALLAVGLAVALGGGGGGSSSSPFSHGSASPVSNGGGVTPASPQADTVEQSVADLADVLDEAGAGRQAAIDGDWQAAIDNRQQVLARLRTLQVDPRLSDSVRQLASAMTYSRQADEAYASCGSSSCPAGSFYDSLATSAKQTFLNSFNPLSLQYGGSEYSETDF